MAETPADTPERTAAEEALDKYTGALSLRRKVDAYSRLMAFFKSQRESTEAEGKRLERRAKSWEELAAGLERHALMALSLVEPDGNGLQRLYGNHSTLTLRANQPHVDVLDISQIPAEFITVTVTMPLTEWIKAELVAQPDSIKYTPLKRAIQDALENGKEVPGAGMSQNLRVQRT